MFSNQLIADAMRKGSLSWLRTAWLIIISFAINDVKSGKIETDLV